MVRGLSIAVVASLLVAAGANHAPHVYARDGHIKPRDGVKVPRYAAFPRHIKRQEKVTNGTTTKKPDPTPDPLLPIPIPGIDDPTDDPTTTTTKKTDPTTTDSKTGDDDAKSTSKGDGGIIGGLTSALSSILDPETSTSATATGTGTKSDDSKPTDTDAGKPTDTDTKKPTDTGTGGLGLPTDLSSLISQVTSVVSSVVDPPKTTTPPKPTDTDTKITVGPSGVISSSSDDGILPTLSMGSSSIQLPGEISSILSSLGVTSIPSVPVTLPSTLLPTTILSPTTVLPPISPTTLVSPTTIISPTSVPPPITTTGLPPITTDTSTGGPSGPTTVSPPPPVTTTSGITGPGTSPTISPTNTPPTSVPTNTDVPTSVPTNTATGTGASSVSVSTPTQTPVAPTSSSLPPTSIAATGSDTMTQLFTPSSIVLESSTAIPKPSTATSTGIPSTLPKLIPPPGLDSIPDQPVDTLLVQIGFLYQLNYKFVIENPIAISQIFDHVPKGLKFGLNVTNGVTMQSLQPYDTTVDKGYITTVAMAFIPKDMLELLQNQLIRGNSRLYNGPDNPTMTIMSVVDNTFPLLANGNMIGANPSGTGYPGAATSSVVNVVDPLANNPGDSKGAQVNTTSVGIGVGVVAGAAVYGAAMFFVARRYRKRRSLHRRSPSLIDTSSMAQSHGEMMTGAGAALMSGRGHSGDHETAYYGTSGRNSRGSGHSGSSRGRDISAPVMAENSLGWN